jgi:hypothetical protein
LDRERGAQQKIFFDGNNKMSGEDSQTLILDIGSQTTKFGTKEFDLPFGEVRISFLVFFRFCIIVCCNVCFVCLYLKFVVYFMLSFVLEYDLCRTSSTYGRDGGDGPKG